jgi:hypothetical protein
MPLGDTGTTMETERIERKEYPSFGECIYCGAKAGDVELTDEHIIPFSLGGNAVILDASCKPCAKETGRIEQVIGRNALWEMRSHIGEQTRRPSERPKTLKFKASVNSGPLIEYEAAIDSAPIFTPMPVMGVPGIYAGDQPSLTFRYYQAHVFHWIPPDIRTLIGARDGDTIEIPYPSFDFDSSKFARAVAKFAYCQALTKYGLGGFRRLHTPALILGKYPYVPYFVGSTREDPPPPGPETVKHAIQLHETYIGRLTLLTASVRLYANSGTKEHGPPIYDVVYGAPAISGRRR